MFEPNEFFPIPWTRAEFEMKPEDVDELVWVDFLRQFKIGEASNYEIEFFGKVVDETGKSLSSASLNVKISGYETDLKTAIKREKLTAEKRTILLKTDEKGQLSISEELGDTITIDAFSKSGYQLKRKKKYFVFMFRGIESLSTHKPDKQNPVVITMTPE